MSSLSYCLLVTGPAYGTQQASSAYQFAQALVASGHKLHSVFFYREGVQNGNRLVAPASDEFDLVRAWQTMAAQHQFNLFICVAAALRRGVADEQQANELNLSAANLADGFELSGLGSLAEAMMLCDRVVQF
ncbi:sulfurtransferase complex subunit TusD [Xenorhabdus bovienii]|uniref:Sulfurtransferase TusD n=1 Tax=Xenorhabdus bovienii TaxID=40576 RepID=A0AAJ1N0H7_XENBV|nr:sulfurtransferase complex subunit TusD [Xenorhabdus bovienii]MDE1479648.1 sulfurtransferase complex subunit TusD [Xenorhabdus bovienii]MDE1488238.1 sulfurtransferase complex subunit TusD [Xenorhabdus bovienii]MDE1491537.1 sulfurtransferase complex subunit TusD [Xenorhabdus bovienii]MDE1496547.1 sulfurtransferase complex subunit TusD [Xenorhabdus bovienii]MDE9474535.1 sulfurtransferase complex subunit TusD [Xenorhabdus bovienii]